MFHFFRHGRRSGIARRSACHESAGCTGPGAYGAGGRLEVLRGWWVSLTTREAWPLRWTELGSVSGLRTGSVTGDNESSTACRDGGSVGGVDGAQPPPSTRASPSRHYEDEKRLGVDRVPAEKAP